MTAGIDRRRGLRSPRPVTPLGERLLRIMAETGQSIGQTAADVGLPKQTFAALVNGTTKRPRILAVQQIARHFGVTIDWLVTGNGGAPLATERRRVTRVVRETVTIEQIVLDGHVVAEREIAREPFDEQP
jgi:transcriptional regulator with XRE-family HTH domain